MCNTIESGIESTGKIDDVNISDSVVSTHIEDTSTQAIKINKVNNVAVSDNDEHNSNCSLSYSVSNHSRNGDLLPHLESIKTRDIIGKYVNKTTFQDTLEIVNRGEESIPQSWTFGMILQLVYNFQSYGLLYILQGLLYWIWIGLGLLFGKPIEWLSIAGYRLLIIAHFQRIFYFLRLNFKRYKKKMKKLRAAFSHYFILNMKTRKGMVLCHPSLKNFSITMNNMNHLSRDQLGGPKFSPRRARTLMREYYWENVSVNHSVLPKSARFALDFEGGLPGIKVKVMETTIFMLLDSGCFHNLITKGKLIELESKSIAKFRRFPHSVRLRAHNDSDIRLNKEGVFIPLEATDLQGSITKFEMPFLVEDSTDERFTILGFNALKDKNLVLDAAQGILDCRLQDDSEEISPHTDYSFSILPDSLNSSHFYIPALKNYNGTVVISPLGECCNIMHAPEVSCEVVAEIVSNPSIQLLNPLSHNIISQYSCSDSFVTNVRNGRFHSKNFSPDLLKSSVPSGSGRIPDQIRETEVLEWPLFPRTDTIFEDCPIRHSVFSSLKQEREDSLHIMGLSPEDSPLLPDSIIGHRQDIDSFRDHSKVVMSDSIIGQRQEYGLIKDQSKLNMQNTAHPGGSIVEGPSGQAGHPTTVPVRERVRPPEESPKVGSPKNEQVNIEPLQVSHKADFTVYVFEGSICSLCHNLCHCDKVLNYPLYERDRLSKGSISRMIDHRTLVIILKEKNEAPALSIFDCLVEKTLSHQYRKIKIGSGSILSEHGNFIKNQIVFQLRKMTFDPPVVFFISGENPVTHVNIAVERPDVHVERHSSLREETIGFPPRILDPIGIEFLSSSDNFDSDFSQLIKSSDSNMEPFLRHMFGAYPDAVSKSATDVGCLRSNDFVYDLELKTGSESLPKHTPYPTSLNARKAANRIIGMWCKSGIAEPSKVHSHASRLICVKKGIGPVDIDRMAERLEKEEKLVIDKSDKQSLFRIDADLLTDKELAKLYRVTLDASDLNKVLKDKPAVQQNTEVALHDLSLVLGEDQCRLPKDFKLQRDSVHVSDPPPPNREEEIKMENLIKSLEGVDEDELLFSSIDVKSAHNILPATKRAQYLMNFISPSFEFYKFVRACFGLASISTEYNSSIITILGDLIALKLVFVYSDDILIIVRGRQNHARVVAEIMRRFARNGIKMSINKCSFFTTSFRHLGFYFDKEGIHLTDERCKTILNYAKPTNLKALQRFLGVLVYIRRFYPFLQLDLAPLTDAVKLTSSTGSLFWGPAQNEAFEKAKQVAGKGLALNFVPGNKKLSLYCDSSNKGGGGVLYIGDHDDPCFKPIAFYSRKYSPHESRLYSALELETINILDCLEKANYYIMSDVSITVHTDAKSLVWLLYSARRSTNQKLARLTAKLSQYPVNFKVIYTKPTHEAMVMADAISRQHDSDKDMQGIIPMSDLRKVKKNDIIVNLQGTMTFDEMCDKVDREEGFSIRHRTDKEVDAEPHMLHDYGTSPLLPEQVRGVHHNFLTSRELSTSNIIVEQGSDPVLGPVSKKLLEKLDDLSDIENRIIEGYVIKKGVIMKVIDSERDLEEDNLRIAIPESLIGTLIGTLHVILGHIGSEGLNKILRKSYFFAKLQKRVAEFCRSCHLCGLNKISSLRKTPLTAYNLATRPMEVLSLDFFHMPSSRGFTCILAIVDHYSQFSWCLPCRNEKMLTVKNHLISIFSIFGPPRVIKSDGGSSLLKHKAIKKLVNEYGISRVVISAPYSPFHNALAERNIRTFRHLFRMSVFSGNKKWPDMVGQVNLIRNTTPRMYRHGLMATPFELFYNRRYGSSLITPEDLMGKVSSYGKSEEEINNISAALIKEMKELKNNYLLEHNRKSGSRISPGDLCLVKVMKLGVNKAGGEGKQASQYHKTLYVVVNVGGTVAQVRNLVTDVVIMVHTAHLKRYAQRKDYFDLLPKDLQERVGEAFQIDLNLKDKSLLMDSLAKAGFEFSAKDNKYPMADDKSFSVVSRPISHQKSAVMTLSEPSSVNQSSGPASISSRESLQIDEEDRSSKDEGETGSSMFGKIKTRLRKLTKKNYRA